MIRIIDHHNPFDPEAHTTEDIPLETMSVWGALRAWRPGFVDFYSPTIILLNGDPVLRAQWDDEVLIDGDVVAIATLPAGGALVYIFFAVVILSVAYSIQMAKKAANLKNPADPKQADPVYSMGAEENKSNLGNPIEVYYGRNRIYPSYAARPFNRYIDGEQYLYQLFCVGQGSFAVEGVYIEDTAIGNFREVTYAIYSPGQQATMFPDNVISAPEVSNLELFAPNQSQHTVYGPYTLNASGTVATRIEVDITFPNGLYRLDDDGNYKNLDTTVFFETRMIDDLDQPISDWVTLFNQAYSYRSPNPLRFTLGTDVAPGRYQIRGRRTDSKDLGSRASNSVYWETARAFLPSTHDYGNVTTLAVAIKATNNLNDKSQNRINLIATRNLMVWNGSLWVEQPTRSPIWAMADMSLNTHYGARMSQSYLDLPKLLTMAQKLAARGDTFDYGFNQKTTVWEAISTALQCGRCEPLMLGPKITLDRDEAKAVPIGTFGADNIGEGSLEWDIEYFDPLEPDSVEMTYIDPVTWKPMPVMCIPPGSTGSNPKRVTLAGSHSRDQAYHEGMFKALANEKRRETVTFTTGLEGVIPRRGNLIAVSYDLPQWGFSGVLLDAGVDNKTLYLDSPMTWTPGVTINMLLRMDDGSGFGPFLVTRGASDDIAVASAEINMSMFSKKIGREPIMFLFGPVDQVYKRCLVREVRPQGGEKVRIVAVNEDNSVFDYDNAIAPPSTGGSVPPKVPDLPEVPYIQVNPVPGNLRLVTVVWGVALGAKYYHLQKSMDGLSWTTVVTTSATSYSLEVLEAGELFVRVCGINVGAGLWEQWNGQVGVPMSVPSPVTGLALQYAFSGLQAAMAWSNVFEAEFYRIRIKDEWNDLLMTRTSTGPEWTLDYNDVANSDAVRRNYNIEVVGVNSLGEGSPPATLAISNPVPAKITNLSSTAVGEDSTHVTYRGSWSLVNSVDLRAYLVWGSTDPAFTPSGSNLLFEGLATAVDIKVPKDGSGNVPIYYWKVTVVDLWGDDYILSDRQQTVPA